MSNYQRLQGAGVDVSLPAAKKTYPLVMSNIAIENGPVEIVDFPIKHGDFSIVFC